MTFSFLCPHCNAETQVSESFIGQVGPCRHCGKTITIPGPGGSSAGSTAPVAKAGSSSSATTIVVVVIAVLVGMCMVGGILVALLLPAIQAARSAAQRSAATNNMKQIVLAMHNYHDANGTFPPQYTTDENGQPLHSWRVLLLPYLEYGHIYEQLNLEEPWDSPYNRQFWDTMPTVFANPSLPDVRNQTTFCVISGPGSLFDGDKPATFAQATDGMSNTIIVAETGNTRNWMEPADLDLDKISPQLGGPPPSIGGVRPQGAVVGFGDGHVQFLDQSISPEVLKAMLTPQGGEAVPF